MTDVAAVIFHPPSEADGPVQRVGEARTAACRDLIARLREARLEPIVVISHAAPESSPFPDVETRSIEAQVPFHFGEQLKDFLEQRRQEGLLYFGSGSGFLLSADEIERLVSFASRPEAGGLFNNFYSCDFAALSNARRLLEIPLPRVDNPLGFSLADAEIPCWEMQRNARTQFDIDTPTDLLVLRASEWGGPFIRSFLDGLDLVHPHLDRLLALLRDRTARVGFLGRVSPRTWSDIERDIACRTSTLSEGRGMRTGSSAHAPLLQQVIQEDGVEAFFDRLATAVDGAILDTRPLLAVNGQLPPSQIRFASDLLRPSEVEDPLWKAFTEAALETEIPVVLGGHSLVNGGLYLLAEACWKGHDLPRRLHAKPFHPDKERS